MEGGGMNPPRRPAVRCCPRRPRISSLAVGGTLTASLTIGATRRAGVIMDVGGRRGPPRRGGGCGGRGRPRGAGGGGGGPPPGSGGGVAGGFGGGGGGGP